LWISAICCHPRRQCGRSATEREGRVGQANRSAQAGLRRDYEHLGEVLERAGITVDAIKKKVAAYGVAIPSWGVGTGGTRFARFAGPGEPRNIFDKLEDCAVI
jgi:L-rhamnose isomerase/sugar isomerase